MSLLFDKLAGLSPDERAEVLREHKGDAGERNGYQDYLAVELLKRQARQDAELLNVPGDAPGWTSKRVTPGEKSKPDIWHVKQPDGSYKPLGRSGKWHVLFGASGAAKTFLAAGLVADILVDQEPVYWADFESQDEDLPSMLAAFGVRDVERLHLFQPEAPPDAAELLSYCALNGIRTVVMDAQMGAISNAVPGEYGNSGADVELFYRGLVRPLTDAGLTVLTIDHVAKTASGGMPIGSQRKFSAADIVLEVESVSDIYQDAELGISRVTVRKYRGGAYRKGDVPANLVYRSGKASIELQPVKPTLEGFALQRPNGTVNRDLERAAAVVAWVAEHQDEIPTGAQIADGLMTSRSDLFTSRSTTMAAIKHTEDAERIKGKASGRGPAKVYELPALKSLSNASQS